MKPGQPYSPHGLFRVFHVPVSVAADPDLSWFAKILFGVLKYHAGKSDRCHVRRDTLAKELGTSEDTVDRGLNVLVKAGLILAKRRGPGKENEYTFIYSERLEESLKRSSESAKVRSQESAESAELPSKTPHFCGTESAELRSVLKEEEKYLRDTRRDIHIASDARFDEFWSLRWRGAGKKEAKKAFRKAVTSEERWQVIRAAVEAQRPAMMAREERFRPHMSAWLNGERWNDEIEAPVQPRPLNLYRVPVPTVSAEAEILESFK